MIYRTNLFGFYRASPKKKPNINPKQIPKLRPNPKVFSKNKKKKTNQNPIRIHVRLNHQMVKLKSKIRNPKEKNLTKDNPLRLRLKPHHQAHRRDVATTPPLETRATELGSGIRDWRSEIGPIGSEHATPTERESLVYATLIGSELAMPQGILLHFTSLSFSLLIFGFCCGLWSVV